MRVFRLVYGLVGVTGIITFTVFLMDMIEGRNKGLTMGPLYHASTDNAAIGVIVMMLLMSIFFIIIALTFFNKRN